ncbi:hypothetical protein CYMTET_26308, partial [Cymbomonas tetramitiformis]
GQAALTALLKLRQGQAALIALLTGQAALTALLKLRQGQAALIALLKLHQGQAALTALLKLRQVQAALIALLKGQAALTALLTVRQVQAALISLLKGQAALIALLKVRQGQAALIALLKGQAALIALLKVRQGQAALIALLKLRQGQAALIALLKLRQGQAALTALLKLRQGQAALTALPKVRQGQAALIALLKVRQGQAALTALLKLRQGQAALIALLKLRQGQAALTALLKLRQGQAALTALPKVRQEEPMLRGAPDTIPALAETALAVLGPARSWRRRVPEPLLLEKEQHSKYNSGRLSDLLRLIRNVHEHPPEAGTAARLAVEHAFTSSGRIHAARRRWPAQSQVEDHGSTSWQNAVAHFFMVVCIPELPLLIYLWKNTEDVKMGISRTSRAAEMWKSGNKSGGSSMGDQADFALQTTILGAGKSPSDARTTYNVNSASSGEDSNRRRKFLVRDINDKDCDYRQNRERINRSSVHERHADKSMGVDRNVRKGPPPMSRIEFDE